VVTVVKFITMPLVRLNALTADAAEHDHPHSSISIWGRVCRWVTLEVIFRIEQIMVLWVWVSVVHGLAWPKAWGFGPALRGFGLRKIQAGPYTRTSARLWPGLAWARACHTSMGARRGRRVRSRVTVLLLLLLLLSPHCVVVLSRGR
jgi:hypothetical protein